eukprot:TRINITY_DN2321_c0_g2_i4.p1 TRINITY_DN2321_c0_g2~~TRINITY_DN2321_c0_g2_i4.p1  ORF type:complete len:187 (+),score=46.49 TRINITY_DN2321_c0_g2_i4:81-563(+)
MMDAMWGRHIEASSSSSSSSSLDPQAQPSLAAAMAASSSSLLSPSDAQSRSSSEVWRPTVDVRESAQDIMINAELPGMKKENIDIKVRGRFLRLSGQRERRQDQADLSHAERHYGRFQRDFLLPPHIDVTGIKVRFEDGLLEIKVPKPANFSAKEKIPIH